MDNDEKKRLWSLFNNLKDKNQIIDKKPTNINSNVLIIDFLNTVIRSYCVNSQMNVNGEYTGAITGTLKSIAYAIRQIKPTRCIIVSDGKGGSKRRRELFPEYKAKRKSRIRLNRSYVDIVTPDSEETNLLSQIYKLVKYLDCLPLTVVAIDNIEADDTIAYLSQTTFKDSDSVTIMSSDKDFYQLTSDKIKVWSPTKKRLYGKNEILSEYGVTSNNFIFYRMLEGDTSDNISGIKGAGLTTIKKCYPFLCQEKVSSLEEIKSFSEANLNKYKLYQSVINDFNIVNRNYQLMQLNTSIIPSYLQGNIMDIIDKDVPRLNKTSFLQLMIKDMIQNDFPNPHVWLIDSFSILDHFAVKK